MWSYQRQAEVSRITFKRKVGLDEAYAAATRLRNEVGATPVEAVIDATSAEIGLNAALVLAAVLEESPVIRVAVLGACPRTRRTVERACATLKVPVEFHRDAEAWTSATAQPPGSTLRPPDSLVELCVGY